MPILAARSPWLLLGHHWGKRGWLVCPGRTITFIDSNDLKAKLLAYPGPAPGSTTDEQSLAKWGPPPMDLEGKKTEGPRGGRR